MVVMENKSDGGQTSDAFWRTARVLVSELSLKWYSFMFLVLFGSNSALKSDFSKIQLVCDRRTDILSFRDSRKGINPIDVIAVTEKTPMTVTSVVLTVKTAMILMMKEASVVKVMGDGQGDTALTG